MMLKLLRRRTGRRVFVAVMATLMLVIAVAPGRTSLAATQTLLLEQKLMQHWPSDDSESLVRALHAASATHPVTVDQFVDALLGALDGTDGETARIVLSQVLPGLTLDPFLSGSWLVDLRRLAQADRVQSLRTAPKSPSSMVASAQRVARVHDRLDVTRSLLDSNLTRGQIRSLISISPLGP